MTAPSWCAASSAVRVRPVGSTALSVASEVEVRPLTQSAPPAEIHALTAEAAPATALTLPLSEASSSSTLGVLRVLAVTLVTAAVSTAAAASVAVTGEPLGLSTPSCVPAEEAPAPAR